jgi:lactobin A/cerein 7B family class IIb bacteriocin
MNFSSNDENSGFSVMGRNELESANGGFITPFTIPVLIIGGIWGIAVGIAEASSKSSK